MLSEKGERAQEIDMRYLRPGTAERQPARIGRLIITQVYHICSIEGPQSKTYGMHILTFASGHHLTVGK